MERTLWLADACIFESCLECALGCRGAWTGLGRLSCMRFANVDCECGGSAVPPFVPRVESEDARFLVLSGGRGDVDRSSPANCGESARAAAMALDKTRLSLRARLLRNARPYAARPALVCTAHRAQNSHSHAHVHSPRVRELSRRLVRRNCQIRRPQNSRKCRDKAGQAVNSRIPRVFSISLIVSRNESLGGIHPYLASTPFLASRRTPS